jgi:hypothetical protein
MVAVTPVESIAYKPNGVYFASVRNQLASEKAHTLSVQVLPNPVSERSAVMFTLPVSGQVHAELVNTSGKTVMNILDGFYKAGTYSVPLNRNSVASGLYMLRLRLNTETQTVPVLIAK